MVLIFARIKPNAKKFKVFFLDDVLHVEIKEKAEDNKANISLIKEFKKIGLEVRIIKGLKSRKKLLEFNQDLENLRKIILNYF